MFADDKNTQKQDGEKKLTRFSECKNKKIIKKIGRLWLTSGSKPSSIKSRVYSRKMAPGRRRRPPNANLKFNLYH